MTTALDLPNESRRQKFDRLAESRFRQCEEALRKLGSLANAYNYDFSKGRVRAISHRLRRMLDNIDKKFADGLRKVEQLRANRRRR